MILWPTITLKSKKKVVLDQKEPGFLWICILRLTDCCLRRHKIRLKAFSFYAVLLKKQTLFSSCICLASNVVMGLPLCLTD